MVPDNTPAQAARALDQNIKKKLDRLRPKHLTGDVRKEFDRVAVILADPTVDRFKALYVDVIVEYAIVVVRLRDLRAEFPDLDDEWYTVVGRNGEQHKSHPHIAQINESWRQWRSLVGELGLSPQAEQNLIPGQGNLFDDPAEKHFA